MKCPVRNIQKQTFKGGLMKHYIVCNWKMSPSSFAKTKVLVAQYNKVLKPSKKAKIGNEVDIVICPPFLYFQYIDEKRNKHLKLGAQNVFWQGKGPYTGQISAAMVKEFGAGFVIVGHTELRRLGDTEEMVFLKIREVLKQGLTPIVCVGYSDWLKEVRNLITNFSAEEINKMMIAYEPREAIGSETALPAQKVAHVTYTIKKLIYKRFKRKRFLGIVGIGSQKELIPKPPLLYGGGVTAENFMSYINEGGVQGFMVGRESLKPDSIAKMSQKLEQSS